MAEVKDKVYIFTIKKSFYIKQALIIMKMEIKYTTVNGKMTNMMDKVIK